MNYVKIADINEIPIGSKKKIETAMGTILVVNIRGDFYALDNKCPHMGGSLGDGTLEGNHIICPKHGATFDVTTGKNVQGAKIAFIKANVKDARSYPLKVEGNEILIGIE